MIIDIIENAEKYLSINTGFIKAFEFLKGSEINALPTGMQKIDADRVFAIIENSPGRQRENAQLEAHEKYIDIQMVLQGTDNMGWRRKSTCRQLATEYQEKTDIQFFADDPVAWLPVEPGMFVIFFPEDAHMPLISPGHIHKVIAKIAVDQM